MESKFTIDLDPTHEGLPYGNQSPLQVLDLYLPEDRGTPAPLVVAVHGGRFSLGNRRWELLHVPQLLAGGWAVASIEYRLAPDARFPAAVQDCKTAVRWLRANASAYRIDPDRFIAWGRSAGGHLAAMLGATGHFHSRFDDPEAADLGVSGGVQAVVAWYAPIDFSLLDEHFDTQPPRAGEGLLLSDLGADSPSAVYLGADPSDVPELARESNPLTHLPEPRLIPPHFLATGDSDRKVPYQQTLLLNEGLRRRGADVTLCVLPGLGHGAVEIETTCTPMVLEWLTARDLSPQPAE